MPTDAERLAAIKARLDAATCLCPTPWNFAGDNLYDADGDAMTYGSNGSLWIAESILEFFVAAPDDVAWLMARIEALMRVNARLRAGGGA